ncbi:MAG: TolB protein [Mariprofundus sp.]|nr:TolB protein [Mariprofundus sp.]
MKTLFLFFLIVAAPPLGYANSLLDWMQTHHSNSETTASATDAAQLLTIEPGEQEMFPRLSPNGLFLMNISYHKEQAWVARRYSENGDPANHITDDIRALDSAAWHDDSHVYFLSERAGALALWEKIADGEGMQRRIQILKGVITQPILLEDHSIIAVRLTPKKSQQNQHKKKNAANSDTFNNWSFPGFHTHIIRFNSDGSAKVLAEGTNPSLSPDGKWIAFSMPVGRSMHLFRMHVDGSELIQVTDSRSVDIQPTWSPDGQWLLFTSNRIKPDMRHPEKGPWDIWSIDISGRNLMQLTQDAGRDGGATMDRDGKVYFHSDRKIRRSHDQKSSESTAPGKGFHIWTITSKLMNPQTTTPKHSD